MNRDIAENVRIPRALYVRFPYGAPLGPASDEATRRAVVVEALSVLRDAGAPGTIIESSVEWPE